MSDGFRFASRDRTAAPVYRRIRRRSAERRGARPSRRRRPRTIRRVDGPAGSSGARHRCMERKKIFRSVWFWVVLVVLLALTFSSFFSGKGGYQEVSTSAALQQFSDGNVEKATINDKEQTLDLNLKKAVEGSDKVTAAYPLGGSDDIFALVSGKGDAKAVNFDTKVTQDNLLVS